MTETLTAKQFQELSKKEKHGRIPRASKDRRTVNGIVFDSLKEAKRWEFLRFREIAGTIRNLERQPKFDLHVNGVRIGSYSADFGYLSNTGQMVVEDVKSPHTRKEPMYRWKIKHLKAEYGIDVLEVV